MTNMMGLNYEPIIAQLRQLRVTPAMESKIANKVWTWEDLLRGE